MHCILWHSVFILLQLLVMHSISYCGILFCCSCLKSIPFCGILFFFFLFCCSCLKCIPFSIVAFYFYFAAVTLNALHFLLWQFIFILLHLFEMHSILYCGIPFLFCCSHLKYIPFSVVAFCIYFAVVTWNTSHFLLWHSVFILLQSLEMHSILWLVRKYLFQCSCTCIRMVWLCTVKTTAPSPFLPPTAVTCICLMGWVVTHTLVNNNNRLFMAPHLVRAQSAYKDIKIHSFHFACRMILSLRPAVISTTLMFHLLRCKVRRKRP